MSVYITREISCDHGGRAFDCGESYYGLPGRTADSVRREARQQGWVFRKGKDYCPRHAGVSGVSA